MEKFFENDITLRFIYYLLLWNYKSYLDPIEMEWKDGIKKQFKNLKSKTLIKPIIHYELE